MMDIIECVYTTSYDVIHFTTVEEQTLSRGRGNDKYFILIDLCTHTSVPKRVTSVPSRISSPTICYLTDY